MADKSGTLQQQRNACFPTTTAKATGGCPLTGPDVAIVPMLYALDRSRYDEDPKKLKPLLKSGKWAALPALKTRSYTLRQLRNGYVYVFDETEKTLHEYEYDAGGAMLTRIKWDGELIGKALPGIATAFAAFSLYANTVGATSLLSGERTRFFAGAAAAGIDLGLAANNVMLKIIVDSNTTRSPWLIFWERGRFDTKNWKFGFGENLSKRTGSSWLNLTRIGSTFAVAATTALFVWDAARAAKQGENDVAMAYSLAAVGSSMWALYTIGLLASPWILGIGVTLFVAGLVGSVLLANSPVEQVVKQGPFGDSDRLEHLNDPLIAYQQLLGILGAPRLKVHRLHQWQKESSKDDREKLILSAKDNNISLTPNDWTVELQTPLLSHFETGLRFIIKAKETVRTRQHFSGWNHLPPIDIPKEKLGGIILDGTRILYILASQNNVITEDDSSRNLRAYEYKLKVYGQFELGPLQCNVGDPFPEYRNIALPQPRPSA